MYRGMDRAALDAAYNNGAAVKDSAQIVAGWEARSAQLRAAHPDGMDLRYGNDERNRIDYFAARRDGPVLMFIHGGYWQNRAKELFAFVAQGPLAWGINVALVGYTLAPQKRLDGIVAEIHASLAWLHESCRCSAATRSSNTVSGWSAGGHLTAMAMSHPAVQRRPRHQRHLRPRADAPELHQRQAAAGRERAAALHAGARPRSPCRSLMAATSCPSYAASRRTTPGCSGTKAARRAEPQSLHACWKSWLRRTARSPRSRESSSPRARASPACRCFRR